MLPLPSIYKSSNSVIQNLSTVNCLAFIRITTELFIEKNSVCKCRVKEVKTWEPLYLEVAPKLDFRVYCFFFFFLAFNVVMIGYKIQLNFECFSVL